METKLLTQTEVANILRVAPNTVRVKMRTGQLPCVEISGKRYMTEEMIEKLIKAGTKRRFERSA